ncbi:MAG: diguanylate cyclase [Gammaproteobacteria bacterium]|nr:diguanylate cyclase [Gammaproteobacteria bacterium]MBU1624937.1 diguanylate cyclase [Gammaproteobacteria bacterium]MBU1982236.1 diguanylate cyclase [Gammaproteobacteria bacterium]
MKAPLPDNEQARLEALLSYDILDTEPEAEFDGMVQLASSICETPIAVISLVDQDRQWFKAIVGLDAKETSRDLAFCAHTILQNDVMVVNDALQDPRFFDNGLVTSDPKIRFYAGAPLITSDGLPLGTICVIDRVPRQLNADQLLALKALASHVITQFELRKSHSKVRQQIRELHQTQKVLSTLINASPDFICFKDGVGRWQTANKSGLQLFHLDGVDYQGKTDLELAEHTHPIYKDAFRACVHSDEIAWQAHTLSRLEETVPLPEGGTRSFDTYKIPLFNDDGSRHGLVVLGRDITARKETEEKLRLAATIFEHSSEAMLITDADNKIINANPAFTQITGFNVEEVAGLNPRILSSGRQDKAFYRDMWRSLNKIGYWQGEVWNRRKNGETFIEWLTINLVFNEEGDVTHHLAFFSDITEKKQADELIWNHANFDHLTQLPNRRLFRDRLTQEIKMADRAKLGMALLFIDLDHFKDVNDTLGHDAGDALLVEAARRISACVRESDTVARLGGDEFTVILSRITDEGHVEKVAQNIIHSLARPYEQLGENVTSPASIGITFYPTDGTDAGSLIKNADQAMYLSKNKGRNCHSYFSESNSKTSA